MLSLLLRARHEDGSPMTDTELRDELMTLLTAGHETTATGLAWAFERLLRTPRALERLTGSLDDDDYLDAVVKETLRVRPVVVDVARKLTRETEIGGWRLPAGTLVLPAIAVLHMRPDLYEAPEEFRPERWLDGDVESYAWIPFGGGVRRCIGASFAQMEMRTVLREVLRRVRLRAPSSRPERGVVRHVTVVPGRGARAIVDQRLAVEPAAELAGAHDGTRRRRARAGRGRRRRSRLTARPGPGRASTSAAMSSSAAFATAPGGEHDADAVAVELERLPVEHDRHVVSPARRELVELGHQPAHRARAVAPPAGRPRSDHVHAVDDPAGHFRRRRNSRIAPTSSSPAPSCRASRTPALSSLVALAIAPNMIEAPKNTTSVHRIVFRSTGQHHTRG